MSTSPEFKERLRREIRLALRELRDGCCDCRASKGFCHQHYLEAMDLILSPRKYLKLEVKK